MQRLKRAYQGRRAVILLGGPSLIEQRFDFGALRGRDFITFVESRALTPRLLESGLKPDYLLMLFPDKVKANALQLFIFRSFLAQVNVAPHLRPEWRGTLQHMREHFDDYLEPGNLARGPHKRYRWKPDAYMKDSAYDLLARLPETRIIANERLLPQHFPSYPYHDRTHIFDTTLEREAFSLERYFEPQERNGTVMVHYNEFLNSAAIALYPLLHYMGFESVYFLGMDMSMLGSMEYAAPYTFRSLWHFRWFFWRSQRVFNADFRRNRQLLFRPKSEFEDAQRLLNSSRVRCVRVYEASRYAAPFEGIPTISMDEFLKL